MSKRLIFRNGDVLDANTVGMCDKHEQRDGRPDPDCPDCQEANE